MGDSQHDRLKGGTKGDAGRAERLAAELRRNLQRRKQRSRAVAARAKATDSPPSEPPAGTEGPRD
jgi:hypothetical protein